MKTDNELIAEFMEYPSDGSGLFFTPHDSSNDLVSPTELPYKTSWDWLMPVVEKIESLPNELCAEYFWNTDDSKKHNDFRIFRVPNITQLFNEIVEFIKWFNEQKTNEAKFKIIETPDYTLVVSDEKLNHQDLCLSDGGSGRIGIDYFEQGVRYSVQPKKIIAYQPKNNAPELDLPLLPESVVEDDVEKLAIKDLESYFGSGLELTQKGKEWIEGFTLGYKSATKKYSEEDLRKAIRYGFDVGFCSNSSNKVKNNLQSEDEFIQSLKQPQTPKWFVAEIENKVKSNGVKELMKDEFYQKFPEELPNCVFEDVLKTTIINGKEYLLGTYLYE
jgi:hypothetical protein